MKSAVALGAGLPQWAQYIESEIETTLEALWNQRQEEATNFTRAFTEPFNSQVCVSLNEDGSSARVAVVNWLEWIGSGQGHEVYEGIETTVKIHREKEDATYELDDWTEAAIGCPIKKTWRHDSPCEAYAYHQKVFSIFEGAIAAIRSRLVEPGWLSETPLWWRVQPLCPKTLRQIIEDGADRQRLLKCAIKVLEAVCFLAAHGITHGDVKADNVTVTPQGEIKLLDGELARTKIIASSFMPLDLTQYIHIDTASAHGVRSPYTDLLASMVLMIRCASPDKIPLIVDLRRNTRLSDLTGSTQDSVVFRALTVISKDRVWGNSMVAAVQQAIVGLRKKSEKSSKAPFAYGVKAWMRLQPPVVAGHTTLFQKNRFLIFKTSGEGKDMMHYWTGASAEDCFALADGTNQLNSLCKINRWTPELPADQLWKLPDEQLPLLVLPGKSKEAFTALQTQAQSMGVWGPDVLEEMKKLIAVKGSGNDGK